jgi:hypothetical protein
MMEEPTPKHTALPSMKSVCLLACRAKLLKIFIHIAAVVKRILFEKITSYGLSDQIAEPLQGTSQLYLLPLFRRQ